jgi:hypothetical protein
VYIEHNQEFSLCDKLRLKKFVPLVFELSEFKQRTRQTIDILKRRQESHRRMLATSFLISILFAKIV